MRDVQYRAYTLQVQRTKEKHSNSFCLQSQHVTSLCWKTFSRELRQTSKFHVVCQFAKIIRLKANLVPVLHVWEQHNNSNKKNKNNKCISSFLSLSSLCSPLSSVVIARALRSIYTLLEVKESVGTYGRRRMRRSERLLSRVYLENGRRNIKRVHMKMVLY